MHPTHPAAGSSGLALDERGGPRGARRVGTASGSSGFTLVELAVVVTVLGILTTIVISNFIEMSRRSREASVKSNCHTVQMAAEDFAVQSDGVYAADLTATTPAGETIIDMLPGDVRLKNPFTTQRSEPRDGAAAQSGQTGYEPILGAGGVPVGYTITGYGESYRVITLRSGSY